MKLLKLAQARANNTGHTQYVVSCMTTGLIRLKQNPQRKIVRDKILFTFEPQKWVRAAKLLRRKTRGGNRVYVGNNVR